MTNQEAKHKAIQEERFCENCGIVFYSNHYSKKFCTVKCNQKTKNAKRNHIYEDVISLDNEVWLDVKGFEGMYMFSNLGRVKSLKRVINRGLYSPMILSEKLMTPVIDINGYYKVTLSRGNKKQKFYIHRLIAETFIDNPENKKCVNHINGIKTDNSISNLEWCTYAENNKHAIDTGLLKTGIESHFYGKTGALCHNSKKVINTETKEIFDSVTIASTTTVFSKSHLSAMLTGKKKNKTPLRYLKDYRPVEEIPNHIY